ncbi:hypothetical protein SNE35_17970 [Paucibacter sp. R3-3]|uniref:Uncharacterized protein n=1 Tax=Roseateles agri TaxID=3098619 RepID=A0ABU5DJD4_9BURK|nr:hypothetical protein [Paucibacter sp. R3-3]MDY0746405.1 hypothetical protein [Paucibacter sp. R3-3]
MTTKTTILTLAAALACAAAPALAATKAAAAKPAPAMPTIPALNASCPAGLMIATDGAGAVRINGKAAKPRRVNDKTVSAAAQGGVVVSLSIGEDGQPVVSTTGPGRAHASCTLADPAAAAAATPAVAPPPARATSSSQPSIAPVLRAAYCRNEVAGKFSIKPESVSMDRPIAESGGGTRVEGTANLGSEGRKAFTCQFDETGRWAELKLP